MQATRIYRSTVIDVKSNDHHLEVGRINLKLKFRKGTIRDAMTLAGSRMSIRNKLKNFLGIVEYLTGEFKI